MSPVLPLYVSVCLSVHVCMYTIPFQLPSVCLSIHACWYTMTLHFLFVYLAESVSMSTLVSLLPWLCLCASVYISSLFMLLSVMPHILSAAGAISDYVIRKYSNSPSVGLRVKVTRPLFESLLAAGPVYSLWQDMSTLVAGHIYLSSSCLAWHVHLTSRVGGIAGPHCHAKQSLALCISCMHLDSPIT